MSSDVSAVSVGSWSAAYLQPSNITNTAEPVQDAMSQQDYIHAFACLTPMPLPALGGPTGWRLCHFFFRLPEVPASQNSLRVYIFHLAWKRLESCGHCECSKQALEECRLFSLLSVVPDLKLCLKHAEWVNAQYPHWWRLEHFLLAVDPNSC